MPAAAQLPLPRLKAPAYARPTMELGTAAGVLSKTCPGITENQVRELIERGAIWAWNVSEKLDGKYPDLRLLTHSVSACSENLETLLDDPYALAQPAPATPDQAVALLMRHATRITHQGMIRGKQIEPVLCIRRTQLRRLIDSGALPEAPGTQRRTGPGGWPIFAPEALTTFLKARLVC